MGKQPEYTHNIDISLLFTLAVHAHFGAICVLREAGVRYWQRVRQAGEIDTALGPRCTQLEHPECGAARATATRLVDLATRRTHQWNIKTTATIPEQ